MWKVYKHTTPSGKVYIGITHQKPETRWANGKGYQSNRHFYNAILKYGWSNIKHEVIAEGLTQQQAEALERALIFKYKSYDADFGYNKALGGHALSTESREKISKTRRKRGVVPWNLGRSWSEEVKAKISIANTGRHYTVSDEGRTHIAEAKRGDKNPNYGKPLPLERIQQLTAIHEKPVCQLIDGKMRLYKSIKEASDATGIEQSNISRVCNGFRKSAGGFFWKFA